MSDRDRLAIKRFRLDVLDPSHEKLVLALFHASWCGPSRQRIEMIEDVATDFDDDELAVVQFDIDDEKFIAQEIALKVTPTVLLFRNGENISNITHEEDPDDLSDLLDKLITQPEEQS